MARYTMQLNLDDESLAVLNGLHERLGTPKTKIARRVFEWFGSQSEEVQLLVLGAMTDDAAERTLRRVLEDLQGKARGEPPGASGSERRAS